MKYIWGVIIVFIIVMLGYSVWARYVCRSDLVESCWEYK